jgi:rod shape-determining protein MreD
MNRHLIFPLFGLLLVFFQTSVLNLVFFGRINVELSMILVMYAGFRMQLIPGSVFSFLLGFFLDCTIGSMSGLYAFLYVCLFLVSFRVAAHAYTEHAILIVVYAFLCSIFEGLMVVLFYRIIYDADILESILHVFLPQALIVGALSPAMFRFFRYIEDLLHDGSPQPAK